jgi:hypothetical protein
MDLIGRSIDAVGVAIIVIGAVVAPAGLTRPPRASFGAGLRTPGIPGRMGPG